MWVIPEWLVDGRDRTDGLDWYDADGTLAASRRPGDDDTAALLHLAGVVQPLPGGGVVWAGASGGAGASMARSAPVGATVGCQKSQYAKREPPCGTTWPSVDRFDAGPQLPEGASCCNVCRCSRVAILAASCRLAPALIVPRRGADALGLNLGPPPGVGLDEGR